MICFLVEDEELCWFILAVLNFPGLKFSSFPQVHCQIFEVLSMHKQPLPV